MKTGPNCVATRESLDTNVLGDPRIKGYVIEFRPFVRFCKFPNCSHAHESDCGVQSAVARSLISTMRYESYRKLTLGDGE